jgi:hypothetical protein
MENGMPDTLYSLEDHFDTLSHSCRWRVSRAIALRASALFALLGDVLSEGHKHRPSLFILPE